MAENLSAIDSSYGFSAPKAESFASLVQHAIDNYKIKITAVKSRASYTWSASIQPLEEAAEHLDRIWNSLEHLNAVVNTAKIREVYEDLLPKITDFHSDLMQDEDLYKIFTKIHDGENFESLSVAQQTLIKNELRDFKLSGMGLGPEKRQAYKELMQRLSAAENNFSNNVLDATEGWIYHLGPEQENLLAGLPAYIIEQAKSRSSEDGKAGWALTLDHSCVFSILSYANNRDLRKTFYEAYNTRASDQGPTSGKWDNSTIIFEILQLRQQIAKLVGYSNYVEYSLVPKMANSIAQVNSFLLNLSLKVKTKAQQEFSQLCDFANKKNNIMKLEAWDVPYYSELYKKQHYDISEEELRVYFPEPRVLTGLFKLVRNLYGIEVEEVVNFEKWHESVRMFKIVDQNNEVRGHFYIDLYEREGKRSGAWVAECISRIRFGHGLLQKPIAYLNCNFSPPKKHKPGLLTHADVETLFHEFGHTLHHVLTQVDYYSVSGMNGVAWDAVELPSQFMENWCWEWPVIQDITEHIETGENLPREIYDKLVATKNYQSALALVRQLEFAIFDLRIHSSLSEDVGCNVQEILNAVRKSVGVIPTPAFNRFQNSFGHIFAGGYAAGYYSYLWAEVLSCDAFEKFVSAGLFNPEVGKAFLTQILEQGGSKPAMDLFVAFAGHEPEVDALLRHHGIVE